MMNQTTDSTISLFSWNIRFGGGSRTSSIVENILQHDADIVVLSEYWNGPTGQKISRHLHEAGWTWSYCPIDKTKSNTVFVASRVPFKVRDLATLPNAERHRCLCVDFGFFDLYGVYFAQKEAKLPLWQYLCDVAVERRDEPSLMIGDFNTGEPGLDGDTFHCSKSFRDLSSTWIDAWRYKHGNQLEYSWYSSPNKGWRIDHVFVSSALLPSLISADYSHAERLSEVSDHSSLIIKLKAK